jgi:ankyrin repeat protein
MNKSKKNIYKKHKTIKKYVSKNKNKNKTKIKKKKNSKTIKKNKLGGGEKIPLIDILTDYIMENNLDAINREITNRPFIVNYNFTIEDGSEVTLLSVAIMFNQIEVIRLLIEKGVDINKIARKVTPLSVCLMYNNMECFNLLIEKGADVNAKNENGSTPIFIAIQKHNLEAFDILLNKNADINVKDNDSITPLHNACSRGYIIIVKKLIEMKANIEATDIYNWTPLFYATEYNTIYHTLQYLLEKGANVNARSILNNTPLDIACNRNKIDFVTILLDYNADINTQDKLGITPLMVATQNGYFDIVKLLLERGADICLKDNRNITAIKFAKEGSELQKFLKEKLREKIQQNVTVKQIDLEKEREKREKEAKEMADKLIEEEMRELEIQKNKLKEEGKKKLAAKQKQDLKKIIEQQEKREREELNLFSKEEDYHRTLLEKEKEQKLYLESLEKQKEEERKIEEEENEKLQKEITNAIQISLKTINADNEKRELIEYWREYFVNEESINNLKIETSKLIKERNSFNKLKNILPAYTNSYVERDPYTSNMISLMFILVGILSNALNKKGIYLMLKGGSAIQNLGSSVSNIPYNTNDIDIILMNEISLDDNKILAEKICKLLVWLTEEENNKSRLTYMTNIDITYPIFKVILNSNKKPLIDIDYNKLVNNDSNKFDISKLYNLSNIYENNFVIDNFNGVFYSLKLEDLINLRIYYLIKYTEINEIKNPKNRAFVLNKIPKSIKYLVKIYFILMNRRVMTECEEPIVFDDLFTQFFQKYPRMKTDFEKTHSPDYSINEIISFVLRK